MDESVETIRLRFFIKLYFQLQAQMPRRGGIHIYATDNMLRNFKFNLATFQMTMSEGVKYSAYAMGFNDDGTRRSPRGNLEAINFQTIDNCSLAVARSVAIPTGGKVVIKR